MGCRRILLFLAVAAAAWAANVKLYMNDGTFQIVREYKVENDRIRFYSVERSDWEEVPKEMVDLKRTESEAKSRQEQFEKDAKIFEQEEKAEREQEKEIMRIPQDPGVYWVEGDQAKVLHAAESMVHTNKGRSVLKVLSPIPVVSGRATLEINNPHSTNIFTNPEQEFYIQLSQTERFGIVRLTPKGTARIVENITIVPVTKDMEEQRDTVDVFQRQLTRDGLYKIWPKQPMLPGEYAVIEFTEGKMNMQIWDFAIKGK